MSLNATTVWEVRGATGSDNNGGGFDASVAGGTDYSLSGTPHVAIDGATITATVQATTTQLKLTGYTVATTDVGNIVNINGGTMTAGRYRIQSVTTGASNLWTLDRSGGTSTQTGTGNMGGCLATIQTALTAMVAANVTYVKADGTYSITTALTCNGTGGTPFRNRVVGYTSSRTDWGQVTIITGAANPAINCINVTTGGGWWWENFILNGAATSGLQGLIGINATQTNLNIINCSIKNFANEGLLLAANGPNMVYKTEVTGCAGTNTSVSVVGTPMLFGCYIHDNTKPGANLSGTQGSLVKCILANNTGASSDGCSISGSNYMVAGNLFYGNGRDGLILVTGPQTEHVIQDNIFAKNGRYGLNQSVSLTTKDVVTIDYNGYWSNSSGATNGLTVSAHEVQISGTDPTNDPFVAKGSANWSLNNTAGAGTLLRGVGFPGSFPALATPVGALDIGPYQHQYPSSIVIINE